MQTFCLHKVITQSPAVSSTWGEKKKKTGFQDQETVKSCRSPHNLCLEVDFICSTYCPFRFRQEGHLLENLGMR